MSCEVDLVDVDGDSIGVLCLKPDFSSRMLDEFRKTAKPTQKRVWFKDDVPGDVYPQGMDRFIVWETDDEEDEICGSGSCDLYLEQVGIEEPKLIVEDVRFSSETFPWVVDAEFSNEPHTCCRILMVDHTQAKSTESIGEGGVLCTSNWFFVIQTLTLTHLERAYGAFCRMNNMEMGGINSQSLLAVGIQSRQVSVRGCLGLRRTFAFESAKEDLIQCSGGLLLTGISHTAEDNRYRLRSHKAVIVEGLRLLDSRSCWYEDQMLSEGLDACLHMRQALERSGSLHSLSALGFAFAIVMMSYQLVCFFAFPAMAVVFLQVLEGSRVETAASDLLQASQLAMHPEDIGAIPAFAKVVCVSYVVISLACATTANVCPHAPGVITHWADKVLTILSLCASAVMLLMLFVMLLFFLIGALLSPSTALKPLIVLGASATVVVNMWMQFSSLTRGLVHVVEEQVNSVFTDVLENMLGRLEDDPEATSYDQSDLDFAFRKADYRFRGLDAEGEPMNPPSTGLFKCIKEDHDIIIDVRDKVAATKTGRSEDEEEHEVEMVSSERAEQLKKLYQHYLAKTSLDDVLEWRIFEETDALTDIMLREHNMRLQLLDFSGIVSAEKETRKGAKDDSKKQLPKAYLIHKSIFRDGFDQMAQMIVQLASEFVHINVWSSCFCYWRHLRSHSFDTFGLPSQRVFTCLL